MIQKIANIDIFNLHHRCGYSVSPFARINHFFTAGSKNRLVRVDIAGRRTQEEGDPKKKTPFSYRKICKGHHTGSNKLSGSAGIDNEAYSSCGRSVMDDVDQNEWIEVRDPRFGGFESVSYTHLTLPTKRIV